MRKKILGNGDFIGGLPLKGDTAIFYSVLYRMLTLYQHNGDG